MTHWASRATRIALLSIVALSGCGPAALVPGTTHEPPSSSAGRLPAPSTRQAARRTAPPESLPRGVTASIRAPGAPLALAFGFDSVWVSSHRGRSLYRVDPDTNRVAATIDLRSTACGDIGVGEGHIWVFTCPAGRTLRVDPKTNQVVDAAPVPGGAMPAFGAGSAWFASGLGPGGRLFRVDLARDRAQAEIRVGATPAYVIFAFDAIWVSNFDDATVSRVDPASQTVTATVPVGPPGGAGSGYMAVVADALWVANNADGRLYRIDPATNSSTPIDIDSRPLTEFYDRYVGGGMGSVWVRTEDRVVARIDPRRRQIVAEFPAGSGGGDVDAQDGSLWVANFGDDTVWRIDLQ